MHLSLSACIDVPKQYQNWWHLSGNQKQKTKYALCFSFNQWRNFRVRKIVGQIHHRRGRLPSGVWMVLIWTTEAIRPLCGLTGLVHQEFARGYDHCRITRCVTKYVARAGTQWKLGHKQLVWPRTRAVHICLVEQDYDQLWWSPAMMIIMVNSWTTLSWSEDQRVWSCCINFWNPQHKLKK